MSTKEQLFERVYSLGDKCFCCECEYGKDDARAKKARTYYDLALDTLHYMGLFEEYMLIFLQKKTTAAVYGEPRAHKWH